MMHFLKRNILKVIIKYHKFNNVRNSVGNATWRSPELTVT